MLVKTGRIRMIKIRECYARDLERCQLQLPCVKYAVCLIALRYLKTVRMILFNQHERTDDSVPWEA